MITSIVAGIALALGQVAAPLPASPPGQPGVEVLPIRQTVQTSATEAAQPAKDAPKDAKEAAPAPAEKKDGNGNGGTCENGNCNGNGNGPEEKHYGFIKTLLRGYPTLQDWAPKHLDKAEKKPGDEPAPEEPPAPRRGFPQPIMSPPFPGGGEYQGAPVVGQPISGPADQYPLTQALWSCCDFLKDNRIRVYGWVDASTNWSTNKNSNAPDSYWLRANRLELDQFVLKIEREVDSVQTDHVDWGFRSCVLYGEDYRFTTAAGWGGRQLFANNLLYGWDPIEQFIDLYIPGIAQGAIFRVGRWVACPDIETQLAPDNALISHSILFTFDTYTQTGMLASVKLSDQWTAQAGVNFGDDQAPWAPHVEVSGFFGARWVSKDNHDSVFTCLNQINDAQFRHYDIEGQTAGHDNYNYVVSTWQHIFGEKVPSPLVTKTEGYFMWQRNAFAGGTPVLGPVQPYGGGGAGPLIPGITYTYGMLNYTTYCLDANNMITLRNEWWRDTRGMRSGFPGTYTSSTIGITHFFTRNLELRTEAGYYRNWVAPAFDNGLAKGAWICGLDMIFRF